MRMFTQQLKNQNRQFFKPLKSRSSGLRQVSIKSSPIIDPSINTNRNSKKTGLFSSKQKNQRQNSIQVNYHESQTQMALVLLQNCLRPIVPQSQQYLHESDQIDSRVIFKINSLTVDSTPNKEKQQKSTSIKIGSKAQRHKQNNKSQPKKVFDLQKLAFKDEQKDNIKLKSNISEPSEKQQSKKTQRKNSPNIFISNKNSPKIAEFSKKLAKFNQDLKKTRKSKILNLNSQTNAFNDQQNGLKNHVNLINHKLQPKIQPFAVSDKKIPPPFEQRSKFIQSETIIPTTSRYPFQNNFSMKRQEINALERTRKILNHSLECYEMATPNSAQQNVQNRKATPFGKINQFEGVIQNEDAQFVLSRFNSINQKVISKQAAYIYETKMDESMDIPLPQPSYQCFEEKKSVFGKRQTEQIPQRKVDHPNHQQEQQDTLRITDYAKIVDQSNLIEQSPLSRRRNTVYSTTQKQSLVQNKLKRLQQGAKTIVTKYDGSEKRSLVEQSVILFQCSKDLHPSPSRDFLNDYAAKYRGSLGVETLIYEDQNQELLKSPRNQDTQREFCQKEPTAFDKIMMSPTNNNKMRKSYSINEVDPNNNNF